MASNTTLVVHLLAALLAHTCKKDTGTGGEKVVLIVGMRARNNCLLLLLLLLLLPQALRQTRSGFNTTFVTPGYNCWLTRAGTSSVEPLIAANQTGWVAGVTDKPNRGPKTIGYSPGKDVVMCWEVGRKLFGTSHCSVYSSFTSAQCHCAGPVQQQSLRCCMDANPAPCQLEPNSGTQLANTPLPRCLQKYEDAAKQAAESRLYGGIHIRLDNDDGLTLGKRLGESVAASLARLSPANYMVKGKEKLNASVQTAMHDCPAWFACRCLSAHMVMLPCVLSITCT